MSKKTPEYEDECTVMLRNTGNHSPNQPIYLFNSSNLLI